jgi:hypothetical protein
MNDGMSDGMDHEEGRHGGAWTAASWRRNLDSRTTSWNSRATAEELGQQGHGGGAGTAGLRGRSLDSRATAEGLG